MRYIALLRPHQWYKNLLVFLPLMFSGNLINLAELSNSLLAFASFCALSSSTYVINDMADRHKDKLHPEKKNRPIASGAIGINTAITIATIALLTGLGLATLLPSRFIIAGLAYFAI